MERIPVDNASVASTYGAAEMDDLGPESGLIPDEGVHALVTVARMYYEQELSQQDIAERLGKSRPTISRMLRAARHQGIVNIDIRVPLERSLPLETALQERLGLDVARVLLIPRGELDSTDRLGRAAASYLQSILQDGLTVGVSNGRTLAAMANYLRPERSLRLEIVQIIGAMGHDQPEIDGPDIARSLAAAYDTTCRFLHVPLLVETASIKATLERDRNIRRTLKMGAEADIALVGVGTLDPNDRSPIFAGSLSQAEVARIRRAGAVGHICGEFYTESGERADVDVNDRTIGIGLEALRRVPSVVAVAGGLTKAAAIVGAVRGNYVSTLITDDRAAERILDFADD
jgi:DNA-binding transcriptional regulator LsrR (DeoR family)